MKSFEKAALTLVSMMTIAAATCPPARAVTVYRCGNAYTNVPCPGAVVIAPDDTRTSDEVTAARAVASREKALGARMEADRRRAETPSVAQPASRVATQARAKVLAALAAPSPGWTGRRRVLLQENGQGDFVAFAPRVSAGSAKK